jgi:hypothetical protein
VSARARATWRLAVARVAIDAGRPARLAMRGTSMLPLLREPMALEVRALRKPARIGDVLVFTNGDRYVAHRVVARRRDGYVTSGDAQPEIVEHVPRAAILGRVEAVWTDDSGSARRVDDWQHRLRGYWYGRGRPVRLALYAVLRLLGRLNAVGKERENHGT